MIFEICPGIDFMIIYNWIKTEKFAKMPIFAIFVIKEILNIDLKALLTLPTKTFCRGQGILQRPIFKFSHLTTFFGHATAKLFKQC